MAMLAEPRRKQKLSLDPRNRLWSDDQSKFGQRMLEKMGWKNGKGLGANEDGKTDHIKVSLKNNTLGVGCSASHEDNWIAHQDDFNDILANLNQDHGNEEGQDDDKKDTDEAIKSLEERSKKSKSRVHYKKFTRGKDLSRYGATDINCILGVRANRSSSSTPKTQSINNSENEDEDDGGGDDGGGVEKEDTSHGITTIIHNTSMQDYFAKKMADLKKARQLQQQNIDNDNQAKGSEERSNQSDDSIENKNKKSKKKKKNKRKKDLDGSQDCDISHFEVEREDAPVDPKKLKKRKQRDSYNGKDSFEGNGQGEKSGSSEEAQNSDDTPRKKKCKRKNKQKELKVAVGDSEQTNISGFVSKKSKKKKKSKCTENL